eukprot:gene8885-835_t
MKIFIVTGGNKGIGEAITENLALNNPDGTIIFTSRSLENGKKTLEVFNKKKKLKNVFLEQLDITVKDSIKQFVEIFKTKYKKFDVLVNNAGWASHGSLINEEIARKTVDTNYYGTKNLTISLLPFANKNGRIVNVTSIAGVLGDKYSKDLKDKFLKEDLTFEELDQIVETFVKGVRDENYVKLGFPKSTYMVSKAAENSLTRILSNLYKKDDRNLTFNACCPGYVATDMSSFTGNKTPKEGAITPCWLATSDDVKDENGKFFSDKKLKTY